TSGPTAATRAHAPTMAAPVQSAVLLRALSRWPRRTGATVPEITRGGASPATVSDPDSGVEHAVEQVHDEVHEDVDDPGEERHAEDGRIVQPGRRRDRVAADPGPGEHRFRQDRARQEAGKRQAGDRADGDQRVSECVAPDDASFA